MHSQLMSHQGSGVLVSTALLVAINLLQSQNCGPANLFVFPEEFYELLEIISATKANVVGNDLEFFGGWNHLARGRTSRFQQTRVGVHGRVYPVSGSGIEAGK